MNTRQTQHSKDAHALMNPEPLLVSVKEAMKLLRVGKTYIYYMRRDGVLGTVKMGTRSMIPIADVRRVAVEGYTPAMTAAERTEATKREATAKQGEAA